MRRFIQHFAFATVAALTLVACCRNAAAADPTGDALLQVRGLNKVGSFYLLEADAKLPESMRALRQAKATVEANTRKRAQVERDIKGMKDKIIALERQYQEINTQLSATKRKNDRIPLEAQSNAFASKIRETALEEADREKDLEKISDSRDDYVGIVLELSDRLESASKQYEALAKDTKIKAAIDSAAGGTNAVKLKLGPSPGFVQELPYVRKERQAINASVVKFNIEGGVPHVLATLNGSSTQTMVFDSGASLVTLNADVARQLSLTAPAKETTVKLQDAKGTLTDARVMILKSIRVGQYTVEDVECAVMPESSHGSNLLGGTFLRNFIYRMDLSSGELHLLPREAGRTKLTPVLPEVAKGTPEAEPPKPPAVAAGEPKSGSPAPTSDPDRWIDLLDGVTQDKWKREGTAMISPGGTNKVILPFTTQGSYEYEVEFTRLDEPMGDGGPSLNVPVGVAACQIVLGQNLGKFVALGKIDGKMVSSGSKKGTGRNLVPSGQQHTARVNVQLDGDAVAIDLTLDGIPILKWSGKQSSLAPGSYDPQPFSLNAWQATMRYSAARIRHVSGELRRCQPVKKDKAKDDATDAPKPQGESPKQ